EYWVICESAYARHLRQVLVLLGEAVLAGRAELSGALRRLVLGYHALAAAGVAGEGVAGEQSVSREYARLYERLHQDDEAAGVAAGAGHASAGDYGLPALCGELREAI